jgi:hypothetical protein
MTIRGFLASAAVAVCLAIPAIAAELKSGPQVDEKLAGPFHPLNVTGSAAGEKQCLYCVNGNNPVAMIFARENSEGLAKLVKKVDEATAANKGKDMGSFVVFLNDKEGLDKELKTMAEKAAIKNVVLSIDNPAGPKGYNVAKDADVTVVLYVNRTVKANYAFKKDEIKDGDIEKIIGDVSKITK